MPEKTVCMISGGIDSPVATGLMAEEKEVVPLHFVLHPYYCEDNLALTMEVIRKLRKVADFDEIVLFPLGSVLKKVFSSLDEENQREYSCVLCRKAMFESASYVCDIVDASSITTGESMGQKASQTLGNIRTTSWEVDYPILRPLIGMDKDEVVRKSKEMGIYMSKHADCCNMTPDEPRTKTDPEKVKEMYEELGLEEMVRKQAEKAEIIDLEESDLRQVFKEQTEKMCSV